MHPAAIGPFKIERELGRGGMGEVYLARDTRLDRQVAIKALPAHLAQDPDRLARFQREAKVLASLNHPCIGAIYGLEEAAGHQYLILEFVEGETLADRLASGAIPIDESLSIAKQIAEALEVAHEKGIIHRDLKPGNVMVTSDTVVKVLDFGLARTADGAPSTSGAMQAMDESPTITSPARVHSPTIPGVILGTAGYMSPEQARGKPVDKRSDIFSFGCVLYEMLTGAQPFAGETVTDSLGAILYREPDWNMLPPGTPAAIARLLRRCLAKDQRERLRDIGDARLELANVGVVGEAAESIPAHSSKPARWIAVGLAVGLVMASAGFAVMRGLRAIPPQTATATAPLTHLAIPMPLLGKEKSPGFTMPSVAITPDGRTVVFIATDGTIFDAFKRQLDSSETTRFLGGITLILSPDGRWLAFLDDSKSIAKVPLSGGVPTPLCDSLAEVRGGCWLDDGTLVITRSTESGLWRVSESGGEPTPLTELDRAAGELSHRWPEALPGARGVLYVVKTSRMDSFDQAKSGCTISSRARASAWWPAAACHGTSRKRPNPAFSCSAAMITCGPCGSTCLHSR